MQSQYIDPKADPHDAIAAQLRNLAPRLPDDPSEFNVAPAAPPEPASELPSGDIRILRPRARSGRSVVLLTVCAGIAAMVGWHSYGEEAKQRLSYLVPQLLADAPTQSANAAEPQDATSQIAAPQPATDPAPAQEGSNATPATPIQPTSAPATPAAETSPTQVALPAELAQSIETMSREIASLKQTVEHLQAGQQQLSRDVAKVSEHGTRHKLTEQTSKPTPPQRPRRAPPPAATTRTQAPYSPPQAYSQGQAYPQGAAQREAYIPPPAAPKQLPPRPGDSSVPRPPMPLQ